MRINWGKEGSFNMGVIDGTQYRCERYWVPDKKQKKHWFLLTKHDAKTHYLIIKTSKYGLTNANKTKGHITYTSLCRKRAIQLEIFPAGRKN